MKKYISIVLGLLAISAALVTVAVGSDPPPPKGSPFASDQTDFAVAAPDGGTIICKNGKELRVKKEKLMELPPTPEEAKKAPKSKDKDNGKMKVWRCGNGPDPDKHPVLVDAG